MTFFSTLLSLLLIISFILETNTFHYRISYFLSNDYTLYYIILPYFYYYLNRLYHSLSSNHSSESQQHHMSQHQVHSLKLYEITRSN